MLASRKITNNTSGFAALTDWVTKHRKQPQLPLVITMEATGVYYEHCAFYLFKEGYNLSVVLPNKAKHYLRSTGLKSKNDKIDAQGLARMGAEQALELWQPMGQYFYQLRALTRHQQSLQELKTNIGNQLHADEQGMYLNDEVIAQLKTLIETLDAQLKEVEKLVKNHIQSDASVRAKVDNICAIKGVGIHTVATILGETNGFTLFKNARQLVSYAGYDVVQNESGAHVGKTRISKKGNSHIRRAMHMPAFCVVRYRVGPFIGLYERTLGKHQRKMKSYVAVQKKLLVLIYALWQKGVAFSESYCGAGARCGEEEPVLPLGPRVGRASAPAPVSAASASEAELV